MKVTRLLFLLTISITNLFAEGELASVGYNPTVLPETAMSPLSNPDYAGCVGPQGLNCNAHPDPVSCQNACTEAIMRLDMGLIAAESAPRPRPQTKANTDEFMNLYLLMMAMSKEPAAPRIPTEVYVPQAPIYVYQEPEPEPNKGTFCIGICADSNGGALIGIGNTAFGGIGIGKTSEGSAGLPFF